MSQRWCGKRRDRCFTKFPLCYLEADYQMSETLEPKVRETLRGYFREVKSLPNEAAKRSRFAALIAELFPGTDAVTEFSRGVEKLIRISQPTGEKRGRADAYYGNAIIEFEKSLPATLSEAEGQLREYVAGTWQKDNAPRSLLAIASDGINWKLYRPVLPAGEKPTPESVTLDQLREFKVSEDSLGDFWLWLTSLLFRPQQIEPTAERFQLDFGTWSPLYREGMAALRRAWVKVSGGSEAKLAFDTWQRYLTVTYGRLTEDTTARKDRETAQEISELESLSFATPTSRASPGCSSGPLSHRARATTISARSRARCCLAYISSPRDWRIWSMMTSSTGFGVQRRRRFWRPPGSAFCHT